MGITTAAEDLVDGADRSGDVHRQLVVAFPAVNGLAKPFVRAFDYEVTPEVRRADGTIKRLRPVMASRLI